MIDTRQQASELLEPPVIHVDALPPGTRLDEFEVLSLLGVGGFGMVYRAYDHSLHRTVAIKEYMPSALTGRSDGLSVSIRSSSDQPTFLAGLKSFVAEARLLAQFDHPSLVKVYRFWEAHNTAYMAMPLYSGMTLTQARNQMQSPPPPRPGCARCCGRSWRRSKSSMRTRPFTAMYRRTTSFCRTSALPCCLIWGQRAVRSATCGSITRRS